MSFSLYIGSEPAYKIQPEAWDHELTGSQVMRRLHEMIRAIPTLANEELHIVVGMHGEARDENIMAMNLEGGEQPTWAEALRRALVHAIPDYAQEITQLGSANERGAGDVAQSISELASAVQDVAKAIESHG